MPECRMLECRNPMWNSTFRIPAIVRHDSTCARMPGQLSWLAVSVSPFVLAMALSARRQLPRRAGGVGDLPVRRRGARAAGRLAGQLRGGHAAGALAAPSGAEGARDAAGPACARRVAARHPDLLHPREAGAVAALSRHARVRGAQQRRQPRHRRRRVPHVRRRRHHRRRHAHLALARRDHGTRRRGPRDSAGTRRRRHPAQGRVRTRAGARR